jgi:hypothetical protein
VRERVKEEWPVSSLDNCYLEGASEGRTKG